MENTPIEPSGSSPAPFDDQPRDPAALQGCGKPFLIGCGVVILLAALTMLVVMVKAKDLFLWGMETYAEQMLTNLPPDVTPEEAERLREAFDAASAAVLEGRVNFDGIRDIQLVADLAAKRELTRDDVLQAIAALERVAASEAPTGSTAGRSALAPASG